MWVHEEPGAYVVMTVGSLIREDFIYGAGWMLGKLWWGQVPELAWVDVTGWGELGEGLVGLVGAVSEWPLGSGQGSSIVVPYAGHLPW